MLTMEASHDTPGTLYSCFTSLVQDLLDSAEAVAITMPFAPCPIYSASYIIIIIIILLINDAWFFLTLFSIITSVMY